MNVKGVTIRFPQEMLEKSGYIAEYEGRSINSHVLVLVRQDIADFEEKHGRIEDDIKSVVHVKPLRKK